ADRNRSHWSTSKTPSYTKSVSWQHHPPAELKKYIQPYLIKIFRESLCANYPSGVGKITPESGINNETCKTTSY
ncbi:hypothetical protein MJS29_10575, partial [Escherichia coli]|uniref:hypothetical protein n=1 Tax=Escherichia coli TaxID=562 RepID=UPI001EFBEA48